VLVLFIQTPFDIVFICFSLFFADKQCGLDGSKLFFSLRLSLSNEIGRVTKSSRKLRRTPLKAHTIAPIQSNLHIRTFISHERRKAFGSRSKSSHRTVTHTEPIETNTPKRIYMEKVFHFGFSGRRRGAVQGRCLLHNPRPLFFSSFRREKRERKKHKVDLTRKKRTTMAK